MKLLPAVLVALLLAACATAPRYRPPPTASWEAKLGGLRNKYGKPLLRPREVNRLREVGARYADIERLLSLRRPDGARAFDGPSLAWYVGLGGTHEYAARLAKASLDGYTICVMQAHGKSIEWVEALTGGEGLPVFTAAQLRQYAELDGSTDYTRRVWRALGYLRSSAGGGHLARLWRVRATPEETIELVRTGRFGCAEDLVR